MNRLETLVRRVRETEVPVTQLRISAPVDLIAEMFSPKIPSEILRAIQF
jgi:hypothetical protein